MIKKEILKDNLDFSKIHSKICTKTVSKELKNNA